MSTVTIVTPEAIRRLRKAGFDEKQVKTIRRVLSDTRGLLTREYHDQGVESLEQRMKLFERRVVIRVGVMAVITAGVIIAVLRPDLIFTIP